MLPKVTEDVFLTKAKTFSDKDTIYPTIKKDNPYLWMLIETVIKNEDLSYDFKDAYCKAAAQFYSLLLAQAEVDEMNNL